MMLALACARILRGLHYLCLARLTQGRGVHGPDERGLERLFTHNVKLYNCAVGLRGTNPELQYDGRLKDVRTGWCQMVNIISL